MITLGKKLLQRGFGNHPLFGTILLLFNMIGVGWFGHLAYQQGNFPPGGSGFPVTTNVFVTTGGSISATGTGAINATTTASPKGATDAGSTTIYLTDPQFNFPGAAQFVCDAGISSGSNIVTTPATDNPFIGNPIRNAAVGDVIWASTAQCGGEDAVFVPAMLIAQGTITSVDSAHQVHVSNNASATCVVLNKDNCTFVWTPNDNGSVQAAWTKAGNACGILVLPAGGIYVATPPINSTSLCNGPAGGNDIGSSITVMGQGPYTTMIITPPVPASWANSMFFDPIGGQRRSFHDFGVASFAPAPAVLSGKTGFSMSFYGEFYNVSFLNWYPCDAIACSNIFIPLQATGVGNAPVYVHDNICLNSGGSSGCIFGSNGVVMTHNAIQNTSGDMGIGSTTGGANYTTENSLVLAGAQGAGQFGSGGGGTSYSTNDLFTCAGPRATSLGCVTVNAPQSVYFKNVTIGQAPATNGPALWITSGSIVSVEGERSNIIWGTANGGSGGIVLYNPGGTVTLRNTTLTCGGTCTAINNSGTILFKEGNIISGGAIVNTGVIQVIQGEGGYIGACTGVVTSATTVALYGLGETTTTTCATAVSSGGQVMTKPGTVYVLYATATAGNQATSAVTVYKNGVAQTMTCSLNGVATCTDGVVAHWVTYIAGDILAVAATAGAADTLANVKGTIVAE